MPIVGVKFSEAVIRSAELIVQPRSGLAQSAAGGRSDQCDDGDPRVMQTLPCGLPGRCCRYSSVMGKVAQPGPRSSSVLIRKQAVTIPLIKPSQVMEQKNGKADQLARLMAFLLLGYFALTVAGAFASHRAVGLHTRDWHIADVCH